MSPDRLSPNLELLQEEFLLIQAWKKTTAYIRSHNWYADTLELDLSAVDLPQFLDQLRQRLSRAVDWKPDPLRMVPAPKSHTWEMTLEGRWQPRGGNREARKCIRPLAHVSLQDQVAATAMLLCLADRVETAQANPTLKISSSADGRRMISYGNRLFCDEVGGQLIHRWGSSKLYRGYFVDYRNFLARPEEVKKFVGGGRIAVVQTDLSKFYDRVRPQLLHRKVKGLKKPEEDERFFDFFQRVFDWSWFPKDAGEVLAYSKASGLSDFERIALPQGLVAAGFFANAVLLDFDEALKGCFGNQVAPNIVLHDACRYVDDLRVVIILEGPQSDKDVEDAIAEWLNRLLSQHANGLEVGRHKTRAVILGETDRVLIRQSLTANRIQQSVSGGFDAKGGTEVIAAIEGLFHTQERFPKTKAVEEPNTPLNAVPDMNDDTAARFSAQKYRTTFRALRPLLAGQAALSEADNQDDEDAPAYAFVLSQEQLDEKAVVFAKTLIQKWIQDPANVRLLRVALDLNPSPDSLRHILGLLDPYVQKGGKRQAPRRIAWYCLAELFRAGATETGLVEDGEVLPKTSDVAGYHEVLTQKAQELMETFQKFRGSFPWYLKQQVLLYLSSTSLPVVQIPRKSSDAFLGHYWRLIRFQKGGNPGLNSEFAKLAILTRYSFHPAEGVLDRVRAGLTPGRAAAIAERNPSFAREVMMRGGPPSQRVLEALNAYEVHGNQPGPLNPGPLSLQTAALSPENPFQDESNLLQLAHKLLSWRLNNTDGCLTPAGIEVELEPRPSPSAGGAQWQFRGLKIRASKVAPALFAKLGWCPDAEAWRLELGQILRFALTGRCDYTAQFRRRIRRTHIPMYRVPPSHWLQRRYSFYNGRAAFGPDWLPISSWLEELLYKLLRWPGCYLNFTEEIVIADAQETLRLIRKRITQLEDERGHATGLLLLQQRATASRVKKPSKEYCLRVCVAQPVIPQPKDYTIADLQLNEPQMRARHRAHLAALLAGVEQMLLVRETHQPRRGSLDWLVLPELSVHPADIDTHLRPFIRRHRCLVLAGLTYEPGPFTGQLINSAVWLIPERTPTGGFDIRRVKQGKQHLAPEEETEFGALLRGFRPCQWLIRYPWSADGERDLILSASVCYDATDLKLCADLKSRSDIYAICALNRDITTFDTMTQALHYHMYQLVILTNNGTFGGSNAYSPYRDSFRRQVFHLHGQPQSMIAFLEIEPDELLQRGAEAPRVAGKEEAPNPRAPWKPPPANWRAPV